VRERERERERVCVHVHMHRGNHFTSSSTTIIWHYVGLAKTGERIAVCKRTMRVLIKKNSISGAGEMHETYLKCTSKRKASMGIT
jgi:hypothetical protein